MDKDSICFGCGYNSEDGCNATELCVEGNLNSCNVDYKTGLRIGDKVVNLGGFVGIVIGIKQDVKEIVIQYSKDIIATYSEANKCSLIKIFNQNDIIIDFK